MFNHGSTAVAFQKAWLTQDTIRRVINLADFRRFPFEDAIHPALIVSYAAGSSKDPRYSMEYWVPKVDWTATQAEVIAISPADRSTLLLGEVLADLDGPDAPQLWKRRLWASPRDLRLLDRLSLHPRLRDHVRTAADRGSDKPWIIAEGFQPLGPNDDPTKSQELRLPSNRFIPAKSPSLDLFLLPGDCDDLEASSVVVRGRSNKNTQVYQSPHVLITKGFKRIAFADFDVSFRHAVRGIHGPKEHTQLLMFLAAYLRTPLAQYFMFHTSSSWGMYRPEGHVGEVLRLPFPLPEQQRDPKRGADIVTRVADLLAGASRQVETNFILRQRIVEEASAEIEKLVEEYFEIQPLERILIEDTHAISTPSIQPTPTRMPVPTVRYSSPGQREAYNNRICETLNAWGKRSSYVVRGKATASDSLGLGVVVLEKIARSQAAGPLTGADDDLLEALDRLRKAALRSGSSVDPIRGLTIFERNRVYIVKPIAQRYWSQSAALNDADEIAGTILMHSSEERA